MGEIAPDLLTEAEVAQMLRCSTKTVARRNIPHARMGRHKRYDRKDVEEYICRAKQPAEPPSPPSKGGKEERSTGRRAGRSRSDSQVVRLARDELSEALALTAKLRATGNGSARRGMLNTKKDSETQSEPSRSPELIQTT